MTNKSTELDPAMVGTLRSNWKPRYQEEIYDHSVRDLAGKSVTPSPAAEPPVETYTPLRYIRRSLWSRLVKLFS